MQTKDNPILDQIAPFNEIRFDVCMAYLSQRYDRGLTQYDMVKLHLMTDIFHMLNQAKPVIGGQVQAWDLGPVVPNAYNRVMHWAYQHDESGFQPDILKIVTRRGKSCEFTNSGQIDESEFSKSELVAMERAWDAIMHLGWNESQDYLHKTSFVGRAWSKARQEHRNIEWDEVIDEYDRENQTDHNHIKALIRF